MATAQQQLNEELDSSPVTTVVMDSLHERFPDGELLNLKQITDFSNIGKQRPVWDSTNNCQLKVENKVVLEDAFRYQVYDTDGKSVIGSFKWVEPSISWCYIRVKTNPFVTGSGEHKLWFELMNKLDTVSEVQNFVKTKGLLAGIEL